MSRHLCTYLNATTDAAPLAAFRVLFGVLMASSVVRFWANGWIEKLYLEPQLQFHYKWFEFVQVPGSCTYLLFALCGISALMVALGWRYRIGIVLFFLSFTYIELMDKTTYLNHYYFISVLAFIMIWLPANTTFSVDTMRFAKSDRVPRWTIDAIKLLLITVYVYAGAAKLNADWLVRAMPLSIWLPSKAGLPVIGPMLAHEWTAYIFSWAGALYDLTIPFLLLWQRTRKLAFVAVVAFHIMTGILFPIGMFPYIMIASATIFFGAQWHRGVLNRLSSLLPRLNFSRKAPYSEWPKWPVAVVACVLLLQLLLPLRSHLSSGDVFWTEQGYRFSWRVMLMEKTGYAEFTVLDKASGKGLVVDNTAHLTPLQIKQMSTQADFIVEYGKFLGGHYRRRGFIEPAVFVESYVALNGRRSRRYVDPEVDLVALAENARPHEILMPYERSVR